MKTRELAGALAEDEKVDRLFLGYIGCRGRRSRRLKARTLALIDRRLLAAYGLAGRTVSIDYSAINQVQRQPGLVKVNGSGVDLTMDLGDLDELPNELDRRLTLP